LTVADVVAKIGWKLGNWVVDMLIDSCRCCQIRWKLGNWVVDILISQVHKKICSTLHKFSIHFSRVSKNFKELEVDFVEMGFLWVLTCLLTYLLPELYMSSSVSVH
jgi:hypothetical protein